MSAFGFFVSSKMSKLPPTNDSTRLIKMVVAMAPLTILATVLLSLSSMSSIRLVSCWSKAGVGTSVVLEYNPNNGGKKRPRIVLDLGATPIYDESIRANTVLISHSHLDHIGAIFSHARAHSVACSGSVPTYFVPEAIREKVEQAKSAMELLDGEERQSPMKIVGVQPGEEVDLPIRGLFARVFGVSHTCPAVGYVILSRHGPVLKPEYCGLDKVKIRELVTSGVAVKTEPRDQFEVAYSGDTSIEGLLPPANSEENNALYLQQAFQCKMFLCEATFLDDSKKAKDLSAKRGHMHVQDIAQVLDEYKFPRDSEQQVALLHISGRYSAKGALDHLADSLPRNVASRCLVAISSHLDQQWRNKKSWTRFVKGNGCILLSDYIRARNQQAQNRRV